MNCHQVQQSFSGYMDGTLNARRRDQIRTHLASCRPCQNEWRAFQALLQGLHDLPSVEPSGDFDRKLRRRLERAMLQPGFPWNFHWWSWRWTLPSVVSLLLVLAVGSYFYLRPSSDAPFMGTPTETVEVRGTASEPPERWDPASEFTAGSPTSTRYVLYTVNYEEPEGLIGF